MWLWFELRGDAETTLRVAARTLPHQLHPLQRRSHPRIIGMNDEVATHPITDSNSVSPFKPASDQLRVYDHPEESRVKKMS